MVPRVISLIAVLSVAGALPALLDANDSALVGSEVSQHVRPFEDLHEAGTESKADHEGHAGKEFSEGDDEKGYYKSKSSKGNKGYKHFDSWHKKGGDKYGFEKHSAQGMKKEDKNGGGRHTSGHYGKQTDIHGAGSEKKSEKLQDASDKDGKAEGTGYSYSHYESEGDDDAGHYTEGGSDDGGHYTDGGSDDGGHYTDGGSDDGGHYTEGGSDDGGHYTDDSSENYEGDHEGYDGSDYHGDSGAYIDDSGAYADNGGAHQEGDSAKYSDGKATGHHAEYTTGPGGATSYYIRHY